MKSKKKKNFIALSLMGTSLL
ncbi:MULTISPECIES: MspA/MspB/MIB-like signal-anchor domain-contatining protein [Parasutterella]